LPDANQSKVCVLLLLFRFELDLSDYVPTHSVHSTENQKVNEQKEQSTSQNREISISTQASHACATIG
jgi:hypothetical protein